MTIYRRGEVGAGETLAAAAVGVLAGAAAFYLARLWWARDPLPESTAGARSRSGTGPEDRPGREASPAR